LVFRASGWYYLAERFERGGGPDEIGIISMHNDTHCGLALGNTTSSQGLALPSVRRGKKITTSRIMATASTSISGNDLSPNANPPRVESSFVALDVPRFKEVHCSTVQVAKGLQYVTWFGGTKEGHADVKIW
jgi:hypothetical protein